MKIAIVDDEVKCQLYTEGLIRSFQWPEEIVVDIFSGGKEICEADVYDVIFMDVEMPGMDGFEAAKLCKQKNKRTIVAFLTTHTELCNRGYMVNAFRYIDKNKIVVELQEAVEAIIDLWKKNKVMEFHKLRAGDYQVPIGEILYIETGKRNVVLHLRNQTFTTNQTMDELENELKAYGFFRSHKSYLVNLEKISAIGKCDVYFENGESAMVSARKLSALKQKQLEYKFRYANS